jgi:hypothetical protein
MSNPLPFATLAKFGDVNTVGCDSVVRPSNSKMPHIVLVIPRGEAVRNFLYSDTLKVLSENARVTLLSVVDDEKFLARFRPYCHEIIPISQHKESVWVTRWRYLIHTAHYRWLWSKVAQNLWEWRDTEASSGLAWAKRRTWNAIVRILAFRPVLEAMTAVERWATWALRANNYYAELFNRIKPDLVFNCSHIHGEAGELPLKVAKRMAIPTAGFIFSWDNLTSRSRIFVPYDYYLVWHDFMKRQLLGIYPNIRPGQVVVTGTPQFDFHFKPELLLSREELCRRIGIDPCRPFILYTTGVDQHFPEEHLTVQLVIDLLGKIPVQPKPQLVVRTYVKGTSPEMKALAARKIQDVVFPPVMWEEKWFTPMYEDLEIYSSLVRHCAMNINAASTVTLEAFLVNKPVINLGWDPPGSSLPRHFRYYRHIEFDHFWPVATSGGTMVARSEKDMERMLIKSLTQPLALKPCQDKFMKAMFDGTADGNAGRRVAETLVQLASLRRGVLKTAGAETAAHRSESERKPE